MLAAPAMGPTIVRSSLEVMLDSLRKKDENPEDMVPALPVRPISKGRLPSSRPSLPFIIESNGLNAKQKNDVASKVVIFGGRKIVNLQQPEESPSSEMPELVSYEERRPEEVRGLEPSTSLSISLGTEDGEKLDYIRRKDTNKERFHVQHEVVEDLQRQVLNAETELRIKEEENLTLKQQMQQYDTRWSDYEAKMKSMEEMWQKQMLSLQMSLAAAKNSLASDDKASQPGRHYTSSNNHYFDSEGTPGKQPCTSAALIARSSDSTWNAVSRMVKEFEQQKKFSEDDARVLIEVKSGQSLAKMNPDEELTRLKVRFATWKKDYKVKLHNTKMELQKLCNSETVKTRRKWSIRNTK